MDESPNKFELKNSRFESVFGIKMMLSWLLGISFLTVVLILNASCDNKLHDYKASFMASGELKNQDFIDKMKASKSEKIGKSEVPLPTSFKNNTSMINDGPSRRTVVEDKKEVIQVHGTNHQKARLIDQQKDDRNWLSAIVSTSNHVLLSNKENLATRRKRFLARDRLEINLDNNENSTEIMTMKTRAIIDTTITTTVATIPTMVVTNKNPLKCRVEKDLYLDFEEYGHYTCANCYNNMPRFLFTKKLLYKKDSHHRIWLYDEQTGRYILPSETDTIEVTFKEQSTYKKWEECCARAIDCCKQNSIYLPKTTDANGQLVDGESRENCAATWDGLGCWPDSPAGQVAQHDCPDHVYFLEFTPICKGQVTKQCFLNGSWFIRNDHEWSDYNNCALLTLYATRLFIGSVWHLVSAVVIGPALIVLDKLPNRSGSKRVRILSNLLFWLLINCLLSATQKIGVIGRIFEPKPDDPPPPPPLSSFLINSTTLSYPSQGHGQPMVTTASPVTRFGRANLDQAPFDSTISSQTYSWNQKFEKVKSEQLAQFSGYSDSDCDGYNITEDEDYKQPSRMSVSSKKEKRRDMDEWENTLPIDYTETKMTDSKSTKKGVTFHTHDKHDTASLDDNKNISHDFVSGVLVHSRKSQQQKKRTNNDDKHIPFTSSSPNRCKRSTSNQRYRIQQSAPVVFICWILSMGIRVTRQLGYAWMFTGAVYLCSVLHFAPAEPPTSFIKWLMILTSGFPVVIGLVYIIVRTIYEPSPIILLAKLPYYYLIGDTSYIEYLWATQLDCWLKPSNNDNIEEIADFPNLVLVILNGGLFVVTLIIMCRITRPGSTRLEMSLGDYFKAAGTLVLLYGAHYALFAYRPQVEGCIKGQIMYYSFLFVDGLQGILVSYVFCYRTLEGKEIISKWGKNWRQNMPNWCYLLSRSRKDQTREHNLLNSHNRSNQSTRSNNSACNGKDLETELIHINETPPDANQF